MQYIQVQHNHLSFSTTSIPEPSEDECLIKVKAIGINRADILQRHGQYPAPAGESEILGLEMSGEIVQVGSHVEHWQVGQRIFGLVAGGAYAEYVVINSSHMMHLPDNLCYTQGAAIAETYLTAFQSLFMHGKLEANQNVLIHAGASGVGTAAIQMAKCINCYVATTVSNEAKMEACKTLNADFVVNYKEEDFVKRLKEEEKLFNVIIDVVAGEYINKDISVAAVDGKIIILSMLGGRYVEHVDIAKMLLKRVQITASTLRNQNKAYKTKLVADFVQQFGTAISTGSITPVIDSVFPWQEAEIAHMKMIDNKNIGKLILTTDNG